MSIKSFEQGIIRSYKDKDFDCGYMTYYNGARLSEGYLKHTGLPDIEYSVALNIDIGDVSIITFKDSEDGVFSEAQEQYRGHVTISYVDGVE